ncbi:hypothetical protein LTR85_004311 [Meristemomyces frigidus]|nr:hypothetical protein LTR85_004311 [Meristemomyces frigidus]
MVAQLQKVIDKDGLKNVRAKVDDATSLSAPDQSVTHILSVAMIGSTSDPQKAIDEMHRVTKSGGIVGITSWVGHCWPEVWQKAVRQSQNMPDYKAPTMTDPSTGSVESVRKLLQNAGWDVVDVKEQKSLFHWPDKQACMDFFFDKEHVNPIAENMRKGLEVKMDEIRPTFEKVFDEVWPDATQMYETAIVAVAWKKGSI